MYLFQNQKNVTNQILETISKLCNQPGKGILNLDGNEYTIQQKFQALGLENTIGTRKKFLEIVLTTPQLEDTISGVVFNPEGLQLSLSNGQTLTDLLHNKGVVFGVRLDTGFSTCNCMNGEMVSLGFDTLEDSCQKYYNLGCRFAKWKSVFRSGDNLPSQTVLLENCMGMARFSVLCQQNGMVSILCPELHYEGTQTMEQSEVTTRRVLSLLMNCLNESGVNLQGVILMPIFITPGYKQSIYSNFSAKEIGNSTLNVLMDTIPPKIPGVFLNSGPMQDDKALQCFKETLKGYLLPKQPGVAKLIPWYISWGFGWTLTLSVAKNLCGKQPNISAAQQEFIDKCQKCQYVQQSTDPVVGYINPKKHTHIQPPTLFHH